MEKECILFIFLIKSYIWTLQDVSCLLKLLLKSTFKMFSYFILCICCIFPSKRWVLFRFRRWKMIRAVEGPCGVFLWDGAEIKKFWWISQSFLEKFPFLKNTGKLFHKMVSFIYRWCPAVFDLFCKFGLVFPRFSLRGTYLYKLGTRRKLIVEKIVKRVGTVAKFWKTLDPCT